MSNDSDVIGGLWLDMNEPSNFIDGYNYTFNDMPSDFNQFSLNFPRYIINNGGTEAPIYTKTIPMDTCTALGLHIKLIIYMEYLNRYKLIMR